MDQVYSTDNYGAVILDGNNNAHVFYGVMMYADDDLTDAQSSWFPGINGIAYWNESFGADSTPHVAQDSNLWYSDMMNNHWILSAPDLNGDSIVAGIDSTGGYALYYASRASMPNIGLTANNEIWLSFSGYTENVDNGTQVFRHIYLTKSSDGGVTWKEPVDVTPSPIWSGQLECIFGSMHDVVDDKVRLIYQRDFEPGLAVRGDEDIVDNNDIVYLEIDTAGLWSNSPTSIEENKDISNSLNIYPNPIYDNNTVLEIYSEKSEQIDIIILDILGKVVYNTKVQVNSGINKETINVSELNKGIYFMNTNLNNRLISKKITIIK